MDSSEKTTRVKLIARGRPGHAWARQTPGHAGRWGNCQFLFDLNERKYDWLVVVDDVRRKLTDQPEPLACPKENTILVTTEPSTITRFGKAFASQFQYVLTSQEEKALPHPNRIHSHTGNLWFHGKSYDELIGEAPIRKSQPISTVCSSKQQKHTLHAQRYAFTQRLKKELPELEIYGHGVRYVEHKYEALAPYRFHLSVENRIAEHHWTEKLADPFLSYAVPIYHGCPNADEYFPADSFVAIDINHFEETLKTIKTLLTTKDEYERRLKAVIEARRRILHEYNLPAMLSQIITAPPPPENMNLSNANMFGRKQMRLRHPADLLSHIRWSLAKTFKKS